MIIQPEIEWRDKSDCSGPCIFGLGTAASNGPQLASIYPVRDDGVGNMTNAWRRDGYLWEKNNLCDGLLAQYLTTCRADKRCWSEDLWLYAERIEWIVVILRHVDIKSQLRSPMAVWNVLVIFFCASYWSVEGEMMSTKRPILEGVARTDFLHSVKPYLLTMSRTKASWWTKHWRLLWVSHHLNFMPRNQTRWFL